MSHVKAFGSIGGYRQPRYKPPPGFMAYANDTDGSMFAVPKTEQLIIFVYFQPAGEDKLYQFRVTERWGDNLLLVSSYLNQIRRTLGTRKRLRLTPDAVEFGEGVYTMTGNYTLVYERIVPYWYSNPSGI